MGNENDKRLNNKNIQGAIKSHNSQKIPPQSLNIDQPQNERKNPYDMSQSQNRIQNQNQNQPNMRMPPPMNTNNGNNNTPMLHRSYTQRRQNTITKRMLKEAFKIFSIDGSFLNRPRFNDAIESIFRFNIPEMHYTHLCNKIYDLLDSSRDGKIQEDEFIDGLGKVLKDRKFRFLLSFMAMMTGDKSRDYIEIKEIKEFFYLSHIEGMKHLGWQLKRHKDELIRNNIPYATIEQLGNWAAKKKKEIEAGLDGDLKQLNQNSTNFISFEDFIRWISVDHTIYIQYGNKNLKIATSLVGLDDIYYDETLI
jgi:Ca2+-binding EF-hand superfamily protein